MSLSRRQMLGALALGAGAGVGGWSWLRRPNSAEPRAGACPALTGQQIRWIVPHAAGGGYDTESRLIEPFLERRLGAQIVIENMPGASGITGARAISSAAGDGRTVGLIGAPGLLVSKMTGVAGALEPSAFTILGRVSRSWHVWATGRNSSIKSLEDALSAAKTRPLVFGLSEVSGVNFVSAGITASILGMPVTMVPGFQGSQAAALAAVRGDVDLVSFDVEALRSFVEGGDLRPLLQVSDRSVDTHESLAGVPVLGGPEGWIARHPRGTNDQAMATALVEVIAAGRIVVAPPALEPAIAACLDRVLNEALMSAELRAASTRSLDVATGAQARADVLAAARDLSLLQQPLQAALAAVKG